jgi:hypothetical protein
VPPRSSSSSSHRRAHHLHLRAAGLITFIFAPPRSSPSSSRRRAHHLHLRAAALITFICAPPPSSPSSSSRRRESPRRHFFICAGSESNHRDAISSFLPAANPITVPPFLHSFGRHRLPHHNLFSVSANPSRASNLHRAIAIFIFFKPSRSS